MFSFASKTNDPNARLRWNERIGYGIGNFGMATVNGLMSGFFMKYLTDVSLYDAAAISTIIAVSKLFDGFSDILMGRIVDKTHSKLGKARIWLLTMCIPLAIVSVLLFSTPSGLSGFAKYAYLFIIYNLVNTVFYTAMAVPYNSLIALSSTDPYEHGMMGNIAMIFQTISNIFTNTFFMGWVIKFSGIANLDTPYKPEAQHGWTMALIVIGIIIVASAVISVLGTKERTDFAAAKGQEKDNVSTGAALKSLFTNKYWLMMILAMFSIFFIIVLYSAGAMYYASDVLGNYALYTPMNNAISIAQFAIMFITPFFMKKFGKGLTYWLGLVAILVGFAGTGIVGANLPLLIVFNALKGLGLGAAGGMAFGMVADTLEYGEWKTGVRAVGMGNAAISAAQKLGLGLGQVALGIILKAGGYVGGAETQSESAKASISFMYNWLPVIVIAIATFVMFFYRLDKQLPQIHEDLTERRKND